MKIKYWKEQPAKQTEKEWPKRQEETEHWMFQKPREEAWKEGIQIERIDLNDLPGPNFYDFYGCLTSLQTGKFHASIVCLGE